MSIGLMEIKHEIPWSASQRRNVNRREARRSPDKRLPTLGHSDRGANRGANHGRAAMGWKDEKNDRKKYNLYLASREWGERKEAVRERANGICERCEVLPMNAVHHLKYDNKYNEPLEDLQAICDPCHEFTHAKDDFDPLANARFINWLVHMNGRRTAWLSHGFTFWDSFQFALLQPVILAWVTNSVARREVVNQCEEEASVTGIEVAYASELTDDLITFWHWLDSEGPTEFPHGSKKAFDRCIELSESFRKE